MGKEYVITFTVVVNHGTEELEAGATEADAIEEAKEILSMRGFEPHVVMMEDSPLWEQ